MNKEMQINQEKHDAEYQNALNKLQTTKQELDKKKSIETESKDAIKKLEKRQVEIAEEFQKLQHLLSTRQS